jgi:hypothetical protein
MLSRVGHMLSYLGPMYVAPMLGLYWACVECWAMLGLCCRACWAYGEECWAQYGPTLGHVEPKFGNLADFRSL